MANALLERLERGSSGPRSRRARAEPGNAANPFRTGMQQARSSERSKPSRWWKSTRAERDVYRVEPAHRREVATPTGSGRTENKRREGTTRAKPRRGGPGDRSRLRVGALKATLSSWRTRQVFHCATLRRVRRRKTPRVRAAMRKAEGGAAKFQRAATASDRMRTHSSRERCVGPEPRRAGQHHERCRHGFGRGERLSHLESL